MKIYAAKQMLFSGLICLIGVTACSKKCPQMDLEDARNEGMAAAQPSVHRLTLLNAQKEFTPKARIATHIADTMQQSLLLLASGSGFYYTQEGLTEVKKWANATKDAIKTAFGVPTNTDGVKLSFNFQANTQGEGKYNKILIGLKKLNKIHTITPNSHTQQTPIDVIGDSIDHTDKSVTYTVSGQQFIFSKGSANTFVLTTAGSKNEPEFSIYPVKLTWKNGKKETLIADNLSSTSAILSAIQEALTNAIAATK